MSENPPASSEVGQLSPDGQWRWDGQAWQPVTSRAPMPEDKKSFGALTRMSVKISDAIVEIQFGIQKVRVPREAVQHAITRRRRVKLHMQTELVLIGSGTELGMLDLSRFNTKAGDEAAEWINSQLQQRRI